MPRYHLAPFLTLGATLLMTWLILGGVCFARGPGNALELDGDDDLVRVPFSTSLALTDAVTLEAWIQPIATDGGGVAGMWGNGGLPDKFLMYLQDGLVTALIARDAIPGLVSIDAPIQTNEWTHVAMTYDGSSLVLYINGAQAAAVDAPGELPDVTLDFRMGIEDIFVPGPASFLEGNVDEGNATARECELVLGVHDGGIVERRARCRLVRDVYITRARRVRDIDVDDRVIEIERPADLGCRHDDLEGPIARGILRAARIRPRLARQLDNVIASREFLIKEITHHAAFEKDVASGHKGDQPRIAIWGISAYCLEVANDSCALRYSS